MSLRKEVKKKKMAEEIRSKFIERVENGKIDAWDLWKPASSTQVLWVYADGSYTRMDAIMRWDGSGIEPAIFGLIDETRLLDEFDYDRAPFCGDWAKFRAEEEAHIKEHITEMWLEDEAD